jgi:hypothetical protein
MLGRYRSATESVRAADTCDELAPLHVRPLAQETHRIGLNEYIDRG